MTNTARRVSWQKMKPPISDRKSTRLNSSHSQISYAVFCLKKKKKEKDDDARGQRPSIAPVQHECWQRARSVPLSWVLVDCVSCVTRGPGVRSGDSECGRET